MNGNILTLTTRHPLGDKFFNIKAHRGSKIIKQCKIFIHNYRRSSTTSEDVRIQSGFRHASFGIAGNSFIVPPSSLLLDFQGVIPTAKTHRPMPQVSYGNSSHQYAKCHERSYGGSGDAQAERHDVAEERRPICITAPPGGGDIFSSGPSPPRQPQAEQRRQHHPRGPPAEAPDEAHQVHESVGDELRHCHARQAERHPDEHPAHRRSPTLFAVVVVVVIVVGRRRPYLSLHELAERDDDEGRRDRKHQGHEESDQVGGRMPGGHRPEGVAVEYVRRREEHAQPVGYDDVADVDEEQPRPQGQVDVAWFRHGVSFFFVWTTTMTKKTTTTTTTTTTTRDFRDCRRVTFEWNKIYSG